MRVVGTTSRQHTRRTARTQRVALRRTPAWLRPIPPGQFAAVRAFAMPDPRFRPAYAAMHRGTARTGRFPVGRLLHGHRHDGTACRVAHEFERQRRTSFASALVTAQAPWSLVEVNGLLAGRTRRLPVAGRHDGLVRMVAGPRRGPKAGGNRFPDGAVTSRGTGNGVSNLVQERVEHRRRRTVQRIILGDLDAFAAVLAHAQPTFGLRQPKVQPCKPCFSISRPAMAANSFRSMIGSPQRSVDIAQISPY